MRTPLNDREGDAAGDPPDLPDSSDPSSDSSPDSPAHPRRLPRSTPVIGLAAAVVAVVLVTLAVTVNRAEPPVAPAVWARSVCTALVPWKATVAELTATAQTEITKTGTPLQTRQTIVTLLAGAESASEQARARVVEAGVPDVDEGESAALQFVSALARARDAYGHAKIRIERLSTGEAKAFYDGVAGAFVTLNEEHRASSLDITTVGPLELRQSFSEVPECQ